MSDQGSFLKRDGRGRKAVVRAVTAFIFVLCVVFTLRPVRD